MSFRPFRGRISAMEKAEIKHIGDYLKDLEEGLYEWDYRGITTQGHLTKLYQIIEQPMMRATFKDDQNTCWRGTTKPNPEILNLDFPLLLLFTYDFCTFIFVPFRG